MDDAENGFSETTQPINDLQGHRARMRAKLERAGPDGLADYELLELVLFRSIPRRDTKPIAKELIRNFGSFAEALNAPADRLQEIKGIGESTVSDFLVMKAATAALLRGNVKERPLLASWSAVMDYCRASMAFETREQFRILFLDKKNRLIRDEVQQVGTVDHTPVYPREVIKRALDLSATAIILVHNHPSGDPTPSTADIEMTQKIAEVASSLGIVLHDHIIIAKDGHASLKGLNLF